MEEEIKIENTERPDRSVKKRIPLSQKGNRLTFKGLDTEKYEYRFVNDKDNRLQLAQDGGYEFVESDQTPGDKGVGRPTKIGKKTSTPVGGGMTAYLMRIDKELYKEDQNNKEKNIAEKEKQMKPDRSKGFYGPGVENK